jgi:hypothetical protein
MGRREVERMIFLSKNSFDKKVKDTIKAMAYDKLRTLIDETHPEWHLSYNPRKKVKKQPPDLTAGEFNRREC